MLVSELRAVVVPAGAADSVTIGEVESAMGVDSVVVAEVESVVGVDSVTVTNSELVDVSVISMVVSGSSVEMGMEEDPERGSTEEVSDEGGRVVCGKATDESVLVEGAAVLSVQPEGTVAVVLG